MFIVHSHVLLIITKSPRFGNLCSLLRVWNFLVENFLMRENQYFVNKYLSRGFTKTLQRVSQIFY